tara:strand:+ start:5950 stop:6087 length:138 start_codon:yes stop_codon:yes gene_type:complete
MDKDILKAVIIELETIIENAKPLRCKDKHYLLLNRLEELKNCKNG